MRSSSVVLAQGAPSAILIPFLAIAAASAVAVLSVSGIIYLARKRPVSTNDSTNKSPRRFWKWLAIISSIAVIGIVGLLLLILESFPGHSWRHRTRETVVSGVDAQTKMPIPLEISCDYEGDDPFEVMEISSINSGPTTIRSNVGPFTIRADGYQSQKLSLDENTPAAVTIYMVRSKGSTDGSTATAQRP